MLVVLHWPLHPTGRRESTITICIAANEQEREDPVCTGGQFVPVSCRASQSPMRKVGMIQRVQERPTFCELQDCCWVRRTRDMRSELRGAMSWEGSR